MSGEPGKNGDVYELEKGEGSTGVQKWRGKEDCTARGLARSPTAGDEEDADALLDLQLPAAIPWTGTKRTSRRRGWWLWICLGHPRTVAMRAATASSSLAMVEKKKRGRGSRGE